MVRDLDTAAPDPRDGRRLEIVVDGLPLFGGAQFWLKPFWLKPFWLKKSITCAILVVVFCVLCKPNCDGSQGMDGVGCSFGVDPGAPRTEATFLAVAIVEAPCNFSCGVSGTTSTADATTSSKSRPEPSGCAGSRGPCASIARRGRHRSAAEGSEIGGSSSHIGGRVAVQLEECQKFVARCEKRIAALDVERSRELERLEEGKSNLERLRLMMTSQQVAPPPDSSSEVEQLRRQVADLQQQLGQGADAPPCAKRQAVVPKERTVRLREDFVPMCDSEIVQWMQDRQANLQDASRTGNASEVTRLCHVIAETASSMAQSSELPSMVTNFTRSGQ